MDACHAYSSNPWERLGTQLGRLGQVVVMDFGDLLRCIFLDQVSSSRMMDNHLGNSTRELSARKIGDETGHVPGALII